MAVIGKGINMPTSLASILRTGPLTCSGQTDYYVASFNGLLGEDSYSQSNGGLIRCSIQWADPFGQNVSNFDVYVINATTNAVVCLVDGGSNTVIYISLDVPIAAGTYALLFWLTPDQRSP